MQTKLRSFLSKQNDISEYQREKRVAKQLQPYKQNINYSQSKFFTNCQQLLQNIVTDAKNEQKIIEHKKKMKLFQQLHKKQQQNKQKVDQMLLVNIMVDYFRSTQMNYCYSMIMREKNITSEDVVMKGQLAEIMDLKKQLHQDPRFNVSILQLLISKLNKLSLLVHQKKQLSTQVSVQCQLLLNNNQQNNMLLTELKLQQIRTQTQSRQKKHYQSQIHLFKSQQLLKLKDDMTKAYQLKEAKVTQKYQEKIREMIKNNTQSSTYETHSKKLQQYLTQIQKLTNQNRTLKQLNTKLQKSSLQHDCFNNQQIKKKMDLIAQQRKQLQDKKYEFQLALRNMSTKVQDLAMQKNKLFNDGKKQTEQYLAKVKTHKENKDYMIEKVYSTLRGFEQRIENLSKDNSKLFEQNQILRNQLNGMKKTLQTTIQQQDSRRRINLTELKIPTKNASIGVTPQQISGETFMEQSKIQSEESVLTYTSEQFQDKMREKAQQNERINSLKLQMNMLKNKVKYLVMDFQ